MMMMPMVSPPYVVVSPHQAALHHHVINTACSRLLEEARLKKAEMGELRARVSQLERSLKAEQEKRVEVERLAAAAVAKTVSLTYSSIPGYPHWLNTVSF